MSFRSTAPGSVMIIGEHAVLHGHQAIVAAIDKKVSVCGELSDSNFINISSAIFQNLSLSLNELSLYEKEDYKFVVSAIHVFFEVTNTTPCGINLSIESSIPTTVGFGSSAAVVVATIKNLALIFSIKLSDKDIFAMGKSVVQKVQGGVGSGSDIAASIVGGVVKISNNNFHKLEVELPKLSVTYVGYKTKTAEVIKIVESRFSDFNALHIADKLYDLMGALVLDAEAALKSNDIPKLANIFNMYQGSLYSLGVIDSNISHIVSSMQKQGAYGVKISGSGLGDCIISINHNNCKYDFSGVGVNVVDLDVNVGGSEVYEFEH